MLGQDLCRAASAAEHEVMALTRAELDITDSGAVSDAMAQSRPDVVINCAAYTNVDGAERESELAHQINATAAGHVAQAAAKSGSWTIHISSDYVFDGAKREPYLESDATAPLSQYGASKLEGERAVAENAPHTHTIVRSSWLFGASGPCFPASILRLAGERDELSVVDDQVGSPTYTGHLAKALVELAEQPVSGALHVACRDHCSWFQFAQEIVNASNHECQVTPGRTEDLGRPAPRPAYSVLASERGAPRLPSWRDGLADYLAAGVSTR
jgi:dTDP-4-dehydrorhamnose reductase